MTRRHWKLGLAITLTAALVAFLVFLWMNPAYAAEEGDVGCTTVEVHHVSDSHTTVTILELTDGMSVDVVGHYLWLQYAHNPTSQENVVSTDLDVWPTGTILTACTDYIATGVIPTGPGTGREVPVKTSDGPLVAVSSTLEPHPSIIDAWITQNGAIAL